ncbi:MAG TPA: hypothetical protein VHQ95_00985, partial [Pyrinomonadaceae bacterium]|nr:hypothetical protein [Pyrinomonadaceae bacterium]
MSPELFIATPGFPVPIPRFQRFSHIFILDLGRWPRLSHHAPLALFVTQPPLINSNILLPLRAL